MFRNYLIINLLLVVLIIILGIWFAGVVTTDFELPQQAGAKEASPESVSVIPGKVLPGEAVYKVIVDKNIFSPERSLSRGGQGATAKAPKDAPKLFGTIIRGNIKSALLKDPVTKTTKNYFIGDEVGDFLVKDIQQDIVILSWGDELVEIRLRERKAASSSSQNRPRVKSRPVPKPTPTPKKQSPRTGEKTS